MDNETYVNLPSVRQSWKLTQGFLKRKVAFLPASMIVERRVWPRNGLPPILNLPGFILVALVGIALPLLYYKICLPKDEFRDSRPHFLSRNWGCPAPSSHNKAEAIASVLARPSSSLSPGLSIERGFSGLCQQEL